ncbi:exodeoxyribonuclease V subunit gamma [Leptospira sp. 2 VSF19]|uniref:Exodeoxyribonuclease V subunit gamma n=1 Tax=Leptospira soteropolitanensis TaxID=2950025 RepID=A0AAW5VHG2_9LEPT|nr:exodeoxyribonuclease V subunit gamma [Leptospira soteropolitanensis]MCW7492515.1 exodeoxyribonuclease V subunit gamma [Leptospira soteropolitanensis]MCW7500564.1 exodeoxyribonuclease V subunit gamma [Leptospira soteropolitanensis]MCW7522766.1 exodeoxyribonuclease V subunit gamma [Leptospira soteropolitanensis]MCW7526623.1 exodeoxyribonuclease V subunit gamma [Leptospira soteropolitanensis]MCW7530534.1 exodeoxyribonuclease V subunit gamma [Leptospira soteropolitanensis]
MPIHYYAGLHLGEITTELGKQITKDQRVNPLKRPLVVVPNQNLIPWLRLNLPKFDASQLSLNIEFTFLEKAILKIIFNSLNIQIYEETTVLYQYETLKRDCFSLLYQKQNQLLKNFPEMEQYLEEIPKLYYLADVLTKYFKDYELNREEWIKDWLGMESKNVPSDLRKDPYWELEKQIYNEIYKENSKPKNLFRYLEEGKKLSLSGNLHLFCLSNLSGTYIDFIKETALATDSKLTVHVYQFHNGKVIGKSPEKTKNYLSKFSKPQSYLAKEFSSESYSKQKSKFVSGGMLSKLKAILLEESLKEENYLEDQTVRVWNAPSVYREIESIAHDILNKISLSKGKLNLLDFAILVPNMNEYRAAIEWVFDGGIYTTQKKENLPNLLKIPYSITDLVAKDTSQLYLALSTLFRCLANDRFEKEDIHILFKNPLVVGNQESDGEETSLQVLELIDSLGSIYEEEKEYNPYTISFGLKRAVVSMIADEKSAWEKLNIVTKPISSDKTIIRFVEIWNRIKQIKSEIKDKLLKIPKEERYITFESLFQNLFSFDGDWERERIYFNQWLKSIESWCQSDWNHTKDFLEMISLITEEVFSEIPMHRGNYLTEGVTVSLLQPMRPIPFLHVYIAGLGEGKFPGSVDRSRFNLRRFDSKPWDLNRREIQESLFWESILSAEESITFSYVGKNTLEDKEFEPCSTLFEVMTAMAIKEAIELPLTSYSQFYDDKLFPSFDYVRNLERFRENNEALPNPEFTDPNQLTTVEFTQTITDEISIQELTNGLRNPILRPLIQNLGKIWEEDENVTEEPFRLNSLEIFTIKSIFIPIFTESLVTDREWIWDGNLIQSHLKELTRKAEQNAKFPYGAFHIVSSEVLLEELEVVAERFRFLKESLFFNKDNLSYFKAISIGDTGLRDCKKLPSYQITDSHRIVGEWENIIEKEGIYYWFYTGSLYDKPKFPNEYLKDYLGKMAYALLSACLYRVTGNRLVIIPANAKDFKNDSLLDFTELKTEDCKSYLNSIYRLIIEENPKYIPTAGLNLFFSKYNYEELGENLEMAEQLWKEFLSEEIETVLQFENPLMKLSPYTKVLLESFSLSSVFKIFTPLLKKGF